MIWWQFLRLTLSALLPQLRRIKRSISDGAYAAYAWSLFGILAPLAWLSVALLPNVSWRWKSMHFFANFLMRASGTPLTVHEPQNLPPPNQPCIIVANHTSYLDGFALVAALPFEFSFVAKMELSEHLIPRVFLHKIHAEFVERFDKQKGIQDALRTAHLAKQGYSLVFFPEGTFTRAPGLLPFHMGAFVAAVEAGIPVIPISIRGTRSILRADEWLPRHGGISVTIGDPIKPAIPNNLTPAERWTEALSMRNAAREQILHYCGEPDLSPQ